MAEDSVQLTDLEVIQQFSLAVRGATASRRDVIAALEADLAYLSSTARRSVSAPKAAPAEPAAAAEKAPARAAQSAKKAPAKKVTAAKSTRRG